MPARPNFTGARIVDGDVRVTGASDEFELEDILDIRVTLVQGDRIANRSAVFSGDGGGRRVTSVWNASFPVKDPAAGGADFRRGPVAAFGVEMRRTNVTMTSWAESLTIE